MASHSFWLASSFATLKSYFRQAEHYKSQSTWISWMMKLATKFVRILWIDARHDNDKGLVRPTPVALGKVLQVKLSKD